MLSCVSQRVLLLPATFAAAVITYVSLSCAKEGSANRLRRAARRKFFLFTAPLDCSRNADYSTLKTNDLRPPAASRQPPTDPPRLHYRP
jgi:hypothetical protein